MSVNFLRTTFRCLASLGLALTLSAGAASANPEALDATSVLEGGSGPDVSEWGADYATWQAPHHIRDLATRAYGGVVTTSSSQENDAWSSANLGDGLPSIYQQSIGTRECVHCGWGAEKGDAAPAISVQFRDGRIADLSAIVLDTRVGKTAPFPWFRFPSLVRVWVKPGEGQAYEQILEVTLPKTAQRNLIPLRPGTRAQAVRIEILGTHLDEPPTMANIEVWEDDATPTSLVEDQAWDLAEPSAGAQVVSFSGFEKNPPVFALTGQDNRAWITKKGPDPKHVVLAFGPHEQVFVSDVVVEFAPGTGLPGRIALDVSDQAQGVDFERIAVLAPLATNPVVRFPVGQKLRHLRLVFEGGADQLAIRKIAVMEGASDLLSLRQRSTPSITLDAQIPAQERAGPDEIEPNDKFANAQMLDTNDVIRGLVSGGDTDIFALPHADTGVPILTVASSDQIVQSLGFWRRDGRPHSGVAGAVGPDGSKRFALLPPDAPDFVSLTAQASQVAIVYDTSGSLEGSERALQNALETYVQSAPAGQRLHLVRFSDEVVTVAPGQGHDGLLAALREGIIADGATKLHEGLDTALDILSAQDGSKAILLIGDGIDSASKKEVTRARILQRANDLSIPIYSIAMGEEVNRYQFKAVGTGRNVFRGLSVMTGGRSFYATGAEDLTRFYDTLREVMAAPVPYELRTELNIIPGTLRVRAANPVLSPETATPVHVILDMSGSMARPMAHGERRIDAAKAVLNQVLGSLPEGIEFGLTVYGNRIPESAGKDTACTDIETPIPPGPLKKAVVSGLVAGLEPSGGTTPLIGSIAAVAKTVHAGAGTRIIVITDGIEECAPNPEAVMRDVRAQASGDIEMNLIGFDLNTDADRANIAEIARAGGGTFVDARGSAAFANALQAAFSADVDVVNQEGIVVAKGRIGGDGISVPSGRFEVRLSGGKSLGAIEISGNMDTWVDIETGPSGPKLVAYAPGVTPPRLEPNCGAAAIAGSEADRVRRVQQKLNALGFNVGPADGLAGRATRAGIEAFSAGFGLPGLVGVSVRLEQHLDCVIATGTTEIR